jgi:two-component sensor histidine kinase
LVGSVLELQMRSHSDESVRKAFASAVNRVHVIANAHDHLQPEAAQPSVDMCEYLTVICRNLGDALRDVRPIAVNVTCPGILLPTDKAVALGFIVNELVTNALKYAFPSDAGGTVSVSLRSSGASLTLEVTDNGKGCPEEGKEGMGSRIVRLLAQQLGSNIRREAAHPGCRVVLSIPNV